ncbi:hypothetical protein LZ838_13910, partial [Pseudomonas sp. AA27]|uniref:hypothetical protein n=1 Tax=Pseudomonas sp. AA27 TaxID=2908652 RepID=UPI001F2D424A
AKQPHPTLALQRGTLSPSNSPNNRRQKTNHPILIAKRHKTVRSFLTKIEKNFRMLAYNHPPAISPFIYGDETAVCYQIESISL